MSIAITPPLFLQADQLKKLNDDLVAKTGCFAFLKTDQVLYATAPRSWQDAYTIFVVGLYAVYHDFGCKFLRILLEDSFCPEELSFPGHSRRHLDVVVRDMRSGVAHGIISPSQRIKVQRQLAGYYLNYKATSVSPEQWPAFINDLSEDDWACITNRLIQDSDQLFQYLERWADSWAKHPDELSQLKDRFSNHPYFTGSFDDRICRPLLTVCGVPSRDVFQYTNPNAAALHQWRRQLVAAFLSGSVTHPTGLYRELERIIRDHVSPSEQTSSDIAARYGFGIPSKKFSAGR